MNNDTYDPTPAEETSRIPWWKPEHAKPLTDTERPEVKRRIRQIIDRNLKSGHTPELIGGSTSNKGGGSVEA